MDLGTILHGYASRNHAYKCDCSRNVHGVGGEEKESDNGILRNSSIYRKRIGKDYRDIANQWSGR